jgi:hypothetical protein
VAHDLIIRDVMQGVFSDTPKSISNRVLFLSFLLLCYIFVSDRKIIFKHVTVEIEVLTSHGLGF